MAKKNLKFECEFDGVATNFKDNGHAYCIDCYVKIRNSAHTHLPVNPWPINPRPTTTITTLTPAIGTATTFPSTTTRVIC